MEEMKEFTYSLISDLHLDFPQKKTPYELLEKNVVVAGDTTNGLEGLRFLQKLKNKDFSVYATDGNHEHYSNVSKGRDPAETTTRFREDHPAIIDIDDTLTLIQTDGWYTVSSPSIWDHYQNDCRNIFRTGPKEATRLINEMALFEAEWVWDMIDSFPERKFVITTHTAPCIDTLDPKFEGAFSNEWYWNPYMGKVLGEKSTQILAWNHGHTHAANEATVHGVRVICNPRGYPGENPDWIPKTITVRY